MRKSSKIAVQTPALVGHNSEKAGFKSPFAGWVIRERSHARTRRPFRYWNESTKPTIMQHTVIGIFANSEDAYKAAEQLRSAGFSANDIDLSSAHRAGYARPGDSRSTSSDADSPYGVTDESRYNQESRIEDRDVLNKDRIDRRKGREDFDEGAGDSIGRFFRNLFDNREEAEKFASAGRSNTIVSVMTSSNEEAVRVADILDTCGAIDIDDLTAETGTYTTAAQRASRDGRTPDGEGLIVDEDIQMEKRGVNSRNVRVRSRIIEKPVANHLRLREEHLYIETTPATRNEQESHIKEEVRNDVDDHAQSIRNSTGDANSDGFEAGRPHRET